jgi:hypothetical protein
LVSYSAISAALLTLNPDDKLGDRTVAEVQELTREQVGEQINTAVKASFDNLMKHLDYYFSPDGAVGQADS